MRAKLAAGSLLTAMLLVPGIQPAAAAGERKDEPGVAAKALRTVDDVAVTNAIRAELARDKMVSVFDIGVQSKEGVVTLTGTVNSRAEALRAEAIARDRENVLRVDNQIHVKTAVGATADPASAERKEEPGIGARALRTVDDVAVTNAIRAELARDKTVSIFDIDVQTQKGIVTLTGTVNSRAEAMRAEAIARDRENVVGVNNQIQVRPAVGAAAAEPATGERKSEPGIASKALRTVDDVAVTNAIRAELARDKMVSVFDIDVESKQGVVTLRGNVKTKAEAQRAEEIAKRDRKNVVRVDNRIVVAPTAGK